MTSCPRCAGLQVVTHGYDPNLGEFLPQITCVNCGNVRHPDMDANRAEAQTTKQKADKQHHPNYRAPLAVTRRQVHHKGG